MSDAYQLQDNLSSLLKWSNDNYLYFNVSKLVFIHFHPKFNTEYNIDGFNIPCSLAYKDLGNIFSNDLSWKIHYEIMISKAYKSFGLSRCIFCETDCLQAKQVDILISKNQALQILYLM